MGSKVVALGPRLQALKKFEDILREAVKICGAEFQALSHHRFKISVPGQDPITLKVSLIPDLEAYTLQQCREMGIEPPPHLKRED